MSGWQWCGHQAGLFGSYGVAKVLCQLEVKLWVYYQSSTFSWETTRLLILQNPSAKLLLLEDLERADDGGKSRHGGTRVEGCLRAKEITGLADKNRWELDAKMTV